MVALLETVLSDPERATPRRYETAQGPAVIFQSPEHVAAVLADPRFKRTSLLAMAFGAGIVTSDDDPASVRRRVLQRQFGSRLVQGFLRHSYEGFGETLARWLSLREIQLCRELNRIALDVVFRSALGRPLGEHYESVARAVTVGVETMGLAAKLPLGEECPLPPTFNASLREGVQLFDRLIYPMLEGRRPQETPPDDFFGMVLASELSDREVRDEFVSLLLAGSETSALTMSWAQVELSRRPDLRARLREEADANLSGSVPPTLEVVANLKLARAVAEEALRLYPPIWQITRWTSEDLQVVDVPVARGTLVVISPYTVHRDDNLWPDPTRFEPDRFLREIPAKTRAQNHIPFGGGHHICLGRRPAMVEVTLLLALLARHLDIELVADRFPATTALTLRHAEPVVARVSSRC